MKTIQEQLDDALAEVARLKKATRCKRAPIKGSLGGVIQEIREQKSLTIHDLSKKSGVAIGLLSRIETKLDANPTTKNVARIAEALGMKVSELWLKLEEQTTL